METISGSRFITIVSAIYYLEAMNKTVLSCFNTKPHFVEHALEFLVYSVELASLALYGPRECLLWEVVSSVVYKIPCK